MTSAVLGNDAPAAAPPSVNQTGRMARLTLGAGVATTIGLIYWLLLLCGYGIEFSDEGYYLNWIAHPELYPASHTQFGFVFHPLYELTGRNIVALRQLNVLLTFGAGWLFFASLLAGFPMRSQGDRLAMACLAFVLASSALAVFRVWLPTPNYNTLAFQGLLLGSAGACLACAATKRAHWIGSVLLGIGLWLTFMGKPTTMAVAGLLWLTGIVAYGRISWHQFCTTGIIALSLVVLSALAIDGSISGFVNRLAIGASDLEKLQGGHTLAEILRLENFHLNLAEKRLFWLGTGLVFTSGYLVSAGWHALRLAGFGLALAGIAALWISLAVCHRLGYSLADVLGFELTQGLSYTADGSWFIKYLFTNLVLFFLPAGSFLVFLFRIRSLPRVRPIVAVLCLLCLPYAFAFGSNTYYWWKIGGAVAFWCAAGLTLVWPDPAKGCSWTRGVPLALFTVVGVFLSLMLATEAPYRQHFPLRANTVSLLTAEQHVIRVSADTQRYVSQMRALLEENGFKPNDPWIDLSGRHPTLAVLVGARHLGLAWLPGGYPGSKDIVQVGLDRVPAELLRQAWVLTEPGGRRSLSPELLHRYGLDLECNYLLVGTIESPLGEYSTSVIQRIYKPLPSDPPSLN
ncbi:MAG TPA: hypothetical protein PKY38_00765 [Opitutaceae bacterium]|nr:hypothetical protein [Opitutaceae bacterium]